LVDDRCNGNPGDGYGAYVDVLIVFNNGEGDGRPVAHDNGGCSGPGNNYSDFVNRDRRIDYVIVSVSEFDADTGHTAATDRSTRKNNPFT